MKIKHVFFSLLCVLVTGLFTLSGCVPRHPGLPPHPHHHGLPPHR
ncbi:MAG TPA: hypothetical protein VGB84_06940 [Arachidicoccus sp.]